MAMVRFGVRGIPLLLSTGANIVERYVSLVLIFRRLSSIPNNRDCVFSCGRHENRVGLNMIIFEHIFNQITTPFAIELEQSVVVVVVVR
jgi:hypothetical protein